MVVCLFRKLLILFITACQPGHRIYAQRVEKSGKRAKKSLEIQQSVIGALQAPEVCQEKLEARFGGEKG